MCHRDATIFASRLRNASSDKSRRVEFWIKNVTFQGPRVYTLGFSRQHVSLAAAGERSTHVFLVYLAFLSRFLLPFLSLPPALFTRTLFVRGLYQLQRVSWIIRAAVKTSKWHMDAWHSNWSSIGTHRSRRRRTTIVVLEREQFYRRCYTESRREGERRERDGCTRVRSRA